MLNQSHTTHWLTLLSVSLFLPLGSGATAQGAWATGTPLPTPRSAMCAATDLNGLIYAIGGIPNGGGGSSVVETYNPTTGTWAQRQPMPTPRYLASSAVGPDGRIYVAGGGQAGSVNVSAFEAYDPSTDTWTNLTPLPFAYGSAGAAFGNDGRLYVMGGSGQTGYAPTFVYNPQANTRSMPAQMPTLRAALVAVAAQDGRIYAIGGFDQSQNAVGTVEAYDPATNTWITRAPMPTARGGMGAALGNDGRIYVFGGNSSQFVPVAQSASEVYDPATNSWAILPSMPTPRDNVAAAADASGRIYVLGGNPIGGQSLDSVEVFTPSALVAYVVEALYDQSRAHKTGSTVPIKLQLVDSSGTNVSAPNISVHATSTTQISGTPTGLLDDSGAANPDYDFRYDANLGGYIFNLSLKGYAPGIYLIHFRAGLDPTDHSLQFQVR